MSTAIAASPSAQRLLNIAAATLSRASYGEFYSALQAVLADAGGELDGATVGRAMTLLGQQQATTQKLGSLGYPKGRR